MKLRLSMLLAIVAVCVPLTIRGVAAPNEHAPTSLHQQPPRLGANATMALATLDLATVDPAPATYTQRAQLAADSAFVGRIGIAAVAGALAVVAEDAETADHAQRAKLAAFVLREPEFVARKLALLIAATAPVQSDGEVVALGLTDAQLQAVVSARWTLLATTLIGGGQ